MDENKTTSQVAGSNGDTHPNGFRTGRYFEFLYKKTEKVGTALYMITNFIKDTDPIKWKLRDKALELLSINSSFPSVSLSERKHLFRQYETTGSEIISIMGIAVHAGLVSEMNFTVLKIKIERILENLKGEGYKESKDETVSLPSSFFDIGHEQLPAKSGEMNIKDTQNYLGNSTVSKGQKISESKVVSKPKEQTKSYVAVVEKKNSRQDIILSLLRKKQGLNIKDFSVSISDCSEKTIQRELIEMLSRGVLRKEGERRWSRYFLA